MKKNKDAVSLFFVATMIGFATGGIVIWKIFHRVIIKNKKETKKLTGYYFILNHWIALIQKEKNIIAFFERNNYKTVAIYGMRELGERLLGELEHTEVVVKCIIDQNIVDIDKNIPVLHPDDSIPEVDVIVVTASYYFNEIEAKLKEKVFGDIIPIDDVIYSKY